MRKLVLILASLIITMTYVVAQEVVPTVKSSITEEKDGIKYYLHLVKKGQTLYSISKTYDIGYEEIYQYNPESREALKEGSILQIPVKPSTRSAGYNTVDTTDQNIRKAALDVDENSDYLLHIVRQGETFFSLTKQYKTSIEELKSINPLLGDYPRTGEILKIKKPEADSIEIDILIHKVEAKETLFGISKKYNISIEDILKYNTWLAERGLQVYDFIKIPKKIIPAKETAAQESEEKRKEYMIHKVVSGDNLYRIAKKYGISVHGLQVYDSTLTTNIHLGQEIKIPLIKPTTSFIIHRSNKKEKLKKIAKNYQVPVRILKEMNPGLGRKVQKDQVVRIPIRKDELINILQEDDKIDSVAYLPVKDTLHLKQCIKRLDTDNQTIKIALLLPLYLDKVQDIDLDKDNIDQLRKTRAFRFLPFYESFLVAVDSMTRKGVHIELSVFDIDHTPSKTIRLLNNLDLLEMDLIVGPLFKNDFTQFANYAKLHEINIINPLSKRNEFIKNNDRVFKLMPDLRERKYLLTSAIQDSFPNSNIVILEDKKNQYASDIHYLKSYFYFQRNEYAKTKSFYSILHSNIADSMFVKYDIRDAVIQGSTFDDMKYKLSTTMDNVVIVLSEDKSFLKETEGKLRKYLIENEDSKIHLFTYTDPEKVQTISIQSFIALDTYFISDHSIDYQNADVKTFVEDCRTAFHFEPTISNYAFVAYDLGLFFMNAIYLYGKDFQNCISYVPQRNLINEFHFEHNKRHGYNNMHWYLMHIGHGGVKKVR
jgi:LysM repeat protein